MSCHITCRHSGSAGLVPWALISGYGDEEEWSLGAFHTSMDVDSFRLKVNGENVSYDNRVEFLAALHSFEIKGAAGNIRQEVDSAKVSLMGDAIYTRVRKISAGLQYKCLLESTIADAVGAEESDQSVDVYLSATKVHLGLVGGYHLLWSVTLRATKAISSIYSVTVEAMTPAIN